MNAVWLNPDDDDDQHLPDETLIIFDWDDTLLCTSAIKRQQCSESKLEVLCETVETTLRAAMELGEVMIVTNGRQWWVEESCRRHLPRLLPLLGRLHVKSARHDYAFNYPGNPFAWKRETFKDILRPRPKATNLVVLGDSVIETCAAHGALHCMVDSSLVKTVKFKDRPSANELIGQLRRVSAEMGSLVNQNGHRHSNLVRRPVQLGHMAGWASGWRLSHYAGNVGYDGLIPDAGNVGTDFSKGIFRVAKVFGSVFNGVSKAMHKSETRATTDGALTTASGSFSNIRTLSDFGFALEMAARGA